MWIKASQNDPSAFKPLFLKYHDLIFNYVHRRVRNAVIAQDVTANTFLKALYGIKNFRHMGLPFSSWLYRIAINEIRLNYRKIKRTAPLTVEMKRKLADEGTADAALLSREEIDEESKRHQALVIALNKLKLKYQTVLTLRYYEEKSIKEIAEILQISENTVKTHIRRGLIYLRKQICKI